MREIDPLRLIDPHCYAEHFCLGAHLARKTSGTLFRELVTRFESIELTSPPQRTASNLVPGLKHMPIRYQIAPRL
jgi:cytochrome P450